MKVCIIGPVESDKYFGGVATFTESLADGFRLQGDEVIIVTDYSVKRHTIKGVPINTTSRLPIRRGLRLPFTLINPVLSERPDLVISSLEYGLVLPMIKHRLPKTKFFHFLHAFPALTTGTFLKRKLLNGSMKLISRYAHKMIANSSLTSAISKEIYGIRVDEIINVAIGFDIIENGQPATGLKEKNTIMFAGRLAKEKNIINLIASFEELQKLQSSEWKVFIAGEGPERKELEKRASNNKIDITFLGQLKPAELLPYYNKTDVFVSINPHEPFGITYLEALFSNCKIVCPLSGGQLDIVLHYPDNFFLVNPYKPFSVANGLFQALTSTVPPVQRTELIKTFGYEALAGKLKDLYAQS